MRSSTIVPLHSFICTSWFLAVVLVNGATFTVVNNCTFTVWPAISGSTSLGSTGFELSNGTAQVFQAPKGWVGRFWGRTGCTFDAAGLGSCETGDCGSGQIECNGADSTAITLAEFALGSGKSTDSYYVNLVNGFNLPMMIEARDGSGKYCQSTGCTEDMNWQCPAELRTGSGNACQNACNVFRASDCGPREYSQVFKKVCPIARIFPTDDGSATLTCSAGDYDITFCPNVLSLQDEMCSRAFQCGSIRDIGYPFWGAVRPEICGFPGFELFNCEGDVPLLNIDSISYRVLGIDYDSQTLQVARQDLWETKCPVGALYSTTLDPKLFIEGYDDNNIFLYYDCTNISHPITYNKTTITYPSVNGSETHHAQTFSCNINRTQTVNFFSAGPMLGSNITCKNTISVPVNQSVPQALSADSASVNDFQDALKSGFSIRWLDNITNCEYCVRSGGVCGYDPDSVSVECKIAHGTLMNTSAVGSALDPIYHSDGSYSTYGKAGLSSVKKVMIGMAALVLTVIVAAMCIIVRFKRRHHFMLQVSLQQETSPNVEIILSNENLAPKRYKYTEIQKITKSFSDKLGQGGYGSVYRGTLPSGQIVAVKILTEAKSNGEDFINEVVSFSKTSHVNIVNLLGFCNQRKRRALVYEFMANKSLDKFISTNGSLGTTCLLDWGTLYKIAVGVARGLEYLHKGCNTRIVHFDIKPQNILLDEEFCPKISDFGLAKLCKKKQSILSMDGTRGTIGYIAPEVFSRNFGGVSYKSDVYSYGMMALEMAGARNIVGLGSVQSSENYFPDKIYEETILHETKNLGAMASEEEEEAARKMFMVGFWCIQTIPSDRPSMSKVVEMLEGSLESIQIPPKPFLFTPTSLGQELSRSASGNVETESSTEKSHDC
ncbi:LEAF RUST 10 DISEASE-RESISTANCEUS RECEPTOR-LIKE PROTEIN KINASE-like 2.5 isoform X2 [Primulina eburnea]|uniref:LEAF RUST 10 DISEASE-RESISTANCEUS RECEPTOR-LIKE PROTEIN KINASE-like 2.5 isoform X2 n=1 Tax=Primulina eburnea TaxID=1245227 RepID=UPI003C6BDBF8